MITRDACAQDLFVAYMRGWRDAVALRSMDKKFTEHKTSTGLRAEYKLGYEAGRDTMYLAYMATYKRLSCGPYATPKSTDKSRSVVATAVRQRSSRRTHGKPTRLSRKEKP